MSWQDNRRRKRAWYQRFEALSGKLKVILENPEATAADILNMFHSYSQAMRLYKYDWIQISAGKSLELLTKDKELGNYRVKAEYIAPF